MCNFCLDQKQETTSSEMYYFLFYPCYIFELCSILKFSIAKAFYLHSNMELKLNNISYPHKICAARCLPT